MSINIKTKNLEITPSLKNYLDEKISSISQLVKKWEEKGAVKINFEVARITKHHHKGDVFYAEVNLFIEGTNIRAESLDDNIRKAIDLVKDKLKIEIKKYREKLA